MDIDIEALIDLLDTKLLFCTTEGQFEGILKLVMVKNQRATFDHVYHLPSRKYMGQMQIPIDNFQSYSLLETPNTVDNATVCEQSCSNQGKRIEIDECVPKNDIYKQPAYPDDYCFIDTIDNGFFRGINHINKFNTIAVSFHGHELTRQGNLSWVCIATPLCVFMFDIDSIGIAAFHNGLKNIFEDESVVKVIHDCREPADILKHLFKTTLINVFDTQVADYLINMQEYTGQGVFKNVNSLNDCLVKYLKLSQQQLYSHNKCISRDAEIELYKMRPVSDDFRKVLLGSVAYAIALKKEQEKLLLEPFHEAVDIYLNILRDASEAEIYKIPSQFTQSAPQYLLDCIKIIRFQDFYIN